LETGFVCVAVHGTVPFLKRRVDEQIGEHGSIESIAGGENAGGFGLAGGVRSNTPTEDPRFLVEGSSLSFTDQIANKSWRSQ